VLDCGHAFHSACVEGWLHRNITCPNCRQICQDTEETC
jgi:hypothetical protein